MATEFLVDGPFEIAVTNYKKARRIEKQNIASLWNDGRIGAKKYQGQTGCYIFVMRAAKGYRPNYVGKTANTFKIETSEPHKLDIYNRVIASKKGTPCFFLIVAPKATKAVKEEIDELETRLISWARKVNKNLENIKKNKDSWSIAGVFNSHGSGKGSSAAKSLKFLLKI